MTRVANLEAAVAALQSQAGKLSAGQATIPALLLGAQTTVQVAIKPAQADTNYSVAALLSGGTNVLSSQLNSHLHSQDWAPFARDLVQARLAQRHLTLEAYSPVFDRLALFNAKALIITMALAFTPLLAIVFRKSHLRTGAHIVFALHLYAFILILLSASVLLAQVDVTMGGGGIDTAIVDNILSIFNLLACGTYLFLSIPSVYSTSGWYLASTTLFLTAALAVLFVGYRFAIFLITFSVT
jgi:hypothetical protein